MGKKPKETLYLVLFTGQTVWVKAQNREEAIKKARRKAGKSKFAPVLLVQRDPKIKPQKQMLQPQKEKKH